jgi:hypothetical protein
MVDRPPRGTRISYVKDLAKVTMWPDKVKEKT